MASITLEPGTKEVKRPVAKGNNIQYEHVYWAGSVQVRIFDDLSQAGISLEKFSRTVKRVGEFTILNDEFESKDKKGNIRKIPARKIKYHGKGEFEVVNSETGSKKYFIAEETVEAFAKVVQETLDNLSEFQARFYKNGSSEEESEETKKVA